MVANQNINFRASQAYHSVHSHLSLTILLGTDLGWSGFRRFSPAKLRVDPERHAKKTVSGLREFLGRSQCVLLC
jgi:hypothetical protein